MKHVLVLLIALSGPVYAESVCYLKLHEKVSILNKLEKEYDLKSVHEACLDDNATNIKWLRVGYEFKVSTNTNFICNDRTNVSPESCVAEFCSTRFSKVRGLIAYLKTNCS